MNTKRLALVTVALLALIFTTSCSPKMTSTEISKGRAERVLVIGVGAITWDEMIEADPPTIMRLAREGAVGNVSVRVTNRAAEAYAALGSGQRTQVSPIGGWAFDADEVVENGSARDLYRRRSGLTGDGEVVVASIDQISKGNIGRGFDARPGLLAGLIEDSGGSTAVIGNADLGIGPLPSRLPDFRVMGERTPPESGIRRDAALTAMRSDGTVAFGSVSRNMLQADPEAPYGVTTSIPRLTEEFDRVWGLSKMVVVETGETTRADSYLTGVAEDVKKVVRARALRSVDRQVAALLKAIDTQKTLIVLIAPTTLGGITERGQLRPVILKGPGVAQGTLESRSTHRRGLVALPDITAAIGFSLGLSPERLAAGRVPMVSPTSSLHALADINTRAVVHDHLRAPVSIIVIGFQVIVYLMALVHLRRGRSPKWMELLLLFGLAFPLASFITHTPIWRAGELASGAAVIAATAILALFARRSMRRFQHGDILLLLGGTFALLSLDLITGARLQLDSIFGYSSVPGGRFYGLGNLGFALLAASAFLVAGMIGSRMGRWRWVALLVVFIALVLDGHPALGDDVGGVLALVPGGLLFAYALFTQKRIPLRYLPWVALLAFGVVLAFGAIDLARPVADRSHLGDFLANARSNPLGVWLVVRRKASLAFSLAIANYWGVLVPAAVAVLISLNLRRSDAWTQQMASRSGLRAGLDALIVAAVVGSILNDSGLAIAGMMLALATPWALLIASRSAESTSPG